MNNLVYLLLILMLILTLNISNNMVLHCTILILIFSGICLYYKYNNVLVPVKSSYDNRIYYVQNLLNKEKASYNLSLVRERLERIVNYLYNKYPNNENILFLKNNFDPDKIIEGINDGKYTSYSVNKGEKIVMCVRQRNDNNDLVDLNTITFVAIHELAHLMTKSIGHQEEFWENMEFILKEVIDSQLNVYNYVPYHKQPEEYCGTTITDTPYKIE